MAVSKEQGFLGELDSENHEEKIELVLNRGDEGSNLQVRSLRWGEGIGWFVQKTITLDSMQVKIWVACCGRRRAAAIEKLKQVQKVIDLRLWKNSSSDSLR
jgi:hypothetical protein